MKMNQNHNLFSFLSRGVTTTHPWCSVFILSICFVFCANYISVSAAQSNIPEMTDWQFSQALDAYAGLTDDQKDIANFLVGSQGYAFAGIAQSNLNTSFSSYSDTVNYVKNFGAKMWEEFNTHVDGVVQNGRNNLLAVKNDLSNFFGNSATYAKSRSETFSAWLGNVGIDYNSTSEFRVQFGKDQAKNNIDYFGDQGLYAWQSSSNIITPDSFTFSWNYQVITNGNKNQQYYTALNNLPSLHVKFNWSNDLNSYYNAYFGDNFFNTYKYIFINLTSRSVYLCDANGNQPAYRFYCNFLFYNPNYSAVSPSGDFVYTHVLSLDNYSSMVSLFQALNDSPYLLLSRQGQQDNVCFSDFIEGLYIGSSWNDKAPWTIDFDFNLSSTSQYVTINAPVNTIYIDLNGFMRDLYDNPTIIYNYVINNSIDGNGDPVDPSCFEPVSKFPGIPDSGITIGTEFFKINGLSPIFGPGSYIDALWNNTKGLVLYIGDIFKVLTLDSIDGGGFAWVIYGAVSVGVIGGIFSKFLL